MQTKFFFVLILLSSLSALSSPLSPNATVELVLDANSAQYDGDPIVSRLGALILGDKICSAYAVTAWEIVTAAHCIPLDSQTPVKAIKPENHYVYLGLQLPYFVTSLKEKAVFLWRYNGKKQKGTFQIKETVFLGSSNPEQNRFDDVAILSLSEPLPLSDTNYPKLPEMNFTAGDFTALAYQKNSEGEEYRLVKVPCGPQLQKLERLSYHPKISFAFRGLGYRGACKLGPGGSGGVLLDRKGAFLGTLVSIYPDGTNLISPLRGMQNLVVSMETGRAIQKNIFENPAATQNLFVQTHSYFPQYESRLLAVKTALASQKTDQFLSLGFVEPEILLVSFLSEISLVDQMGYSELSKLRQDFFRFLLLIEEFTQLGLKEVAVQLGNGANTQEVREQLTKNLNGINEIKAENLNISRFKKNYKATLHRVVSLWLSNSNSLAKIWNETGLTQFKTASDLFEIDSGISGSHGVGARN